MDLCISYPTSYRIRSSKFVSLKHKKSQFHWKQKARKKNVNLKAKPTLILIAKIDLLWHSACTVIIASDTITENSST